MTTAADYEKLGMFYLGRAPETEGTRGELVLYDSRHLVTHGLCVGMTGSGKTGLGIGLLEEAAIDGIPALVIDPKGDMGNLLLTFPDLAAADFEPWVEVEEAERKGLSRRELAEREATKWSQGLADWGQDGARIQRFRDAVDITLYTPGSTAGVPLAVLSSLAAPGPAVRGDEELLGDRVTTAASSLLGLADLDPDARSREFVLLSTLLENAWKEGRDLDLPKLIQEIQEPPVTRVGVLELESFYPAKDRFDLAMALNNLLASPGFSAWLDGAPLDIDRLLYTEEGRPQVAICSLAHLDDRERMFFVALLLQQVVSWMREQSGTSSLRALIYMDEIFGYFPPVAEPPSKKPLLTLLKQARAYGVGLLLATQNPVDLDYKALGNIGTWFLGRLQTDRDKQRLLDGLEGASGRGGRSRSELDDLLSGLGKRRFLLHDVREEQPVLFETRWVLSYLKGPLTRREIERLTADDPARSAGDPQAGSTSTIQASVPPKVPSRERSAGIEAPVLPSGITQTYLVAAQPVSVFEPQLLGRATVRFEDRKIDLRWKEELVLEAPVPAEGDLVEWRAVDPELDVDDGDSEAPVQAPFGELPAAGARSKSYTAWRRELVDHVYHEHRLLLWRSPSLEELSRPEEDERAFRIRLAERARERRDGEKAELQTKYDAKLARLEARAEKARQKVEVQKEQLSGQKLKTAVSVGTSLLSALLGRKRLSRSTINDAGRALRGVDRSRREASDVERAQRDLEVVREEIVELESELGRELLATSERYRPEIESLERVEVSPLKKNIRARSVELLWVGR